jgi:hypothetical protein
VRELTFVALLTVALEPGGATLLMMPIAVGPAACARSGEIAAANRVSKVPTWRRLTTKRIVNMRISALVTAALARLPPLKTCALRRIPTALGTTLRSLLAAISADPSRGGTAKEVEAKAIAALALELRVNLRPEGFV